MNIFRVLSIICSIAFIILLIVSLNVEASAGMTLAVVIVGIITAGLNIISTAMWWVTDVENEYNSNQLHWFRMSSH